MRTRLLRQTWMSSTCPILDRTIRILQLSISRSCHSTSGGPWKSRLKSLSTDRARRSWRVNICPPWRRHTSTLDVGSSDHPRKNEHNDASTDTSAGTNDPSGSADSFVTLDEALQTSRLALKENLSLHRVKTPSLVTEWKLRAHNLREEHMVRRPWLAYLEGSSDDHYSRMSDEIRAFESYMRPTLAEETLFQLSIKSMRKIVAEALPSYTVSLHGSRSTGLASPFSDVDISVYPTNSGKEYVDKHKALSLHAKKNAAVKILRVLKQKLDSSTRFSSNYIVFAEVPILSTTDIQTSLVYQILTGYSVSPSRERTQKYLSDYPNLRPLYILLRHALFIRGLTSVQHGGLGSYSLLMIIAFALQRNKIDNLALQLYHVLRFWQRQHYDVYAYGAEDGLILEKSYEASAARINTSNPYIQGLDIIRRVKPDKQRLLCLQDPGNPLNDLGKKCSRIDEVMSFFSSAVGGMAEALEGANTDGYYGIPAKGYLSLIEAEYRFFEMKRKKLANAGELFRVFETDKKANSALYPKI